MFYYFNAEMKYYEKPVPTPKPFATATDAELADLLNAYYNDLLSWQDLGWAVGDTRLIHLDAMHAPSPNSSNTWAAQDITVVIVAHDHNDLATPINGHTKAALTVQTREVMNNNQTVSGAIGHIFINGVNAVATTFTKWSNLYMRTYLNNTVWDAFPSTLKTSIKPSNHYRHTTYNGTESEQVTDNLFLPSYPEIFGTASNQYYTPASPAEGTQFEYYQTSDNRIKYGNNDGSSNELEQHWWTSSTSSTYSSTNKYLWMKVSMSGSAGISAGYNAYALAPAFCM